MNWTSPTPFQRKLTQVAALSLVVGMLISTAKAQVFMFDFGPTTPTGANLTNSPAHAAGVISISGTSWNIIGVADVSSGLTYADGTPATGIGIRTGVESTSTSGIINYLADPSSSSSLGSAINTGIYTGDSVAKDGIFQSTNDFAIGVQLTGLAAGTYEIYLSGRNTNTNGSPQGMIFYGAASTAGDSFSFSSLSGVSVSNPGTTGYPTWTNGQTYATMTVTLTAGQVLNLADEGAGSGSSGRGFLNSLQIVAVPEPATSAMLWAGAGMLILRRRRHIR